MAQSLRINFALDDRHLMRVLRDEAGKGEKSLFYRYVTRGHPGAWPGSGSGPTASAGARLGGGRRGSEGRPGQRVVGARSLMGASSRLLWIR